MRRPSRVNCTAMTMPSLAGPFMRIFTESEKHLSSRSTSLAFCTGRRSSYPLPSSAWRFICPSSVLWMLRHTPGRKRLSKTRKAGVSVHQAPVLQTMSQFARASTLLWVSKSVWKLRTILVLVFLRQCDSGHPVDEMSYKGLPSWYKEKSQTSPLLLVPLNLKTTELEKQRSTSTDQSPAMSPDTRST